MSQRAATATVAAGLIAGLCAVGCRPRDRPRPSVASSAALAVSMIPASLQPTLVPPAATADKMEIRSAKPVRWSEKCDAATLRALKTGRRRLVIVVNAYEPPKSGDRTFVVNLMTGNGKKRREIRRFTIFPDSAFQVSDGAKPQRFQVSLKDHVDSLEDSKIDLEVGFDAKKGKRDGGRAEIEIEFADVK